MFGQLAPVQVDQVVVRDPFHEVNSKPAPFTLLGAFGRHETGKVRTRPLHEPARLGRVACATPRHATMAAQGPMVSDPEWLRMEGNFLICASISAPRPQFVAEGVESDQ